ncbi:HTH-type transcriptional regulator [Legionella busanensis]|uniref:HTH-type transcriptional regulator n=1 Tax=Legionella busanensis TaxID=190655 RepID=A0A378JMN7_9GAMM|nr:helix-turn-helix transcriptional regulator [Legionella busanensis]STX52327.1 HTH-type transcriptional regulator [Legionella busanensis]
MNNYSICENLRKLMKLHSELSLSELARQTKIPQPTLHHLLNGITKKPRKKVLESLASYFNISIAQLMGEDNLYEPISEDIKRSFKIHTVPIINWDMLKYWPNNYKEAGQLGEIVLTRDMSEYSFALIMKHALTDPFFPEGSILIFDFKQQPKDREFIIVNSFKYNKIILNRLFIEKSDHFIKQEQPNGDVKLIKLDLNKDKILGSLIEARLMQF